MSPPAVVVLAGGTGGAKMANGFQQVLDPGRLTVVVNVADDTELFGLHVSPDIDSVLYTLAGVLNIDAGWGVSGDTWTALAMLERYGEPAWFRIGDADLATHVRRTHLLRSGATLTSATADMTAALGVPSHVVPATDDRVRTLVETDEGDLHFQEYFVRERQAPAVRGIRFEGIEAASVSPAASAGIASADLIVIGPSNPIVSIAPILELPGMRGSVAAARAPVVAVSPIIAGRALKGPADRMLGTLGHEPSAVGVAMLYAGLADTFVMDRTDADLAPAVEALGMRTVLTQTVMEDASAQVDLARAVLDAMLDP